jgi:hypothetical protein
MMRLTTIVAVVADNARDLVEAVAGDATNVTAVLQETPDQLDPGRLKSSALRRAEAGNNVYTLIDFDPMAAVVDAWVARLGGKENHLDVEVGRIGAVALPEYFLVADDIDDARVHWYHGHLNSYAPRRVVTIEPSPPAIHRRLSHLRSDRAFPTADVIARAALDYSPTTLSSTETDGPTLVRPFDFS